jgi:signal transduction histidine kinase
MFRTIRWKLIASYVILAVFTVSLVGFVSVEIVRYYARQQQLNQLQANARAIAGQAASVLSPVVRIYELGSLAETTSYLGNLRVRILDNQQRLLVDSGLPSRPNEYVILQPQEDSNQGLWSGSTLLQGWMAIPLDEYESFDPLREAMQDSLPPGMTWTLIRRLDTPWGTRVIFVESSDLPKSLLETDTATEASQSRTEQKWQEPILKNGVLLGYVEVSAGPDLTIGALTVSRQAFLLSAIGTGLLAIVLGLLMSHRISAPLNELKAAAGKMGTGDLGVRAPVYSDDELGALANQFNTMAGQLQTSFSDLAAERDALRRFIADASHELRTPITALKNFIILLQDAAGEDPQVRAEFLSESQTQLERLEWITTNLLDLSRLDAGIFQLEMQPISLNDLIRTSSAPFGNIAESRGISLTLDLLEQDSELNGDSSRLEIALSNLIDNALKFTPEGGTVNLSTKIEADQVQIYIHDTGVGIPEDDLPHIFDRFYRGRHPEISGSGLGLSIVKSILQAHHGEIRVAKTSPSGTTFLVTLPRVPSEESD